ncbi:MAG: hypothetical protein RR894_14480 [Terrisporobacter sp.]
MAKTCESIGIGGKTIVAKEFKVSRNTIRKGYLELTADIKLIQLIYKYSMLFLIKANR